MRLHEMGKHHVRYAMRLLAADVRSDLRWFGTLESGWTTLTLARLRRLADRLREMRSSN